MNKVCWTMLAVFAIQASVFSQSADIEAWVERSDNSNGLVSFTGTVKNLTSTVSGYTYVMTTSRRSPQGTSNNSQSGTFTLEAEAVELLSTVRFRSLNSEYISIELVILDRDKEVARVVSTSGAPPAVIDTTTVLQKAPKELKSIQLPSSLEIASEKLEKSSVSDALEIDGLIINETRTKSGRDFYGFFYKNWQPPAQAENYSITFKEYPSRGRAARVGVEVNGKLVYKTVLQPRLDLLEMAANQAIGIVKKHLIDQKNMKAQMGSDDQSGSGLF